ncbi:hypothetical protein QUB36_13520 [Microcoleus sp. AT8-B1]|uniref:hypothetical protein n=1 Tax=unclassified Microcoleus TaxID=2642155 RepID=UPI002FD7128F
MSKIEFNTEDREVTITRRIGRGGESTVTLSPEEAGIEINLGIAKIGATTDFGGAISLGIAGQEVTWGREGGTIHIGIGGFAVDVEARDCIVTETKSIFGQIVAQRSYPDPGCKPPEPPVPPEPPEPDPAIGIDPTTITDTNDAYVLIGQTYYNIVYNYPNPWFLEPEKRGYTIREGVAEVKCGQLPEIVIAPHFYQWWTIPVHLNIKQRGIDTRWVNGDFVDSTSGYTYFVDVGANSSFIQSDGVTFRRTPFGSGTFISQYRTGPYPPSMIGLAQGYVCFGSPRAIAKWVMLSNQPFSGGTPRQPKHIINGIIPIGKQKPLAPLLPTGNKPPMNNCCEEVLDMLEDIKEAYAVDRILKDKFPVSNAFMAPECDTASQTQAKNFYEILQCLFRMLAHGLIFEPRVLIKDADAAKAGDQEFKARYLNATGWASAVAEALMEVKDDGNVSTNMDIRNSFASTQTMVGLADAIYKLEAVIDMLGVEVIPKMETVETPFNVQIQIGKGFGDGNERQIDLNQDEATEKLLPTLLQTKKNKIKTIDIHPRSRSIKEILENIEANLPGINNG